MLNHKFFAYCPKTMVNGPSRCGKMSNDPIIVNATTFKIKANNLQLKDDNKERKYDSCYYEFES